MNFITIFSNHFIEEHLVVYSMIDVNEEDILRNSRKFASIKCRKVK